MSEYEKAIETRGTPHYTGWVVETAEWPSGIAPHQRRPCEGCGGPKRRKQSQFWVRWVHDEEGGVENAHLACSPECADTVRTQLEKAGPPFSLLEREGVDAADFIDDIQSRKESDRRFAVELDRALAGGIRFDSEKHAYVRSPLRGAVTVAWGRR